MKKLSIVLMALVWTVCVQAQGLLQPDPEVRTGKLENGLTYYIRHNETPKNQADFYIAQKVGSILEDDTQRGLAHFLEHMCFNGTENFPGNALLEWCRTKGVKFGENLNAYTSWDQTVYQIMNVPVSEETVQDSCLLILHDWADALTLADEEIDAERGVIHQEWRSRNVGEQRLREQLFPKIMPGNKYAVRFPIGTMEVVDNFPYQALRDYYEAWYRPDQQAVIVVGDVDVDRIEGKIKELFSPIKMPENAQPRDYVPVEDTPGTIFAIGSDPELPGARFEMYFKHEPLPDEIKQTQQYLAVDYMLNMINIMLNSRLSEIAATADSPYTGAVAYYGDMYMAKTKDALTFRGTAKGKDVRPAFAAVYREMLRAARGGFTVSEYERAKSRYLAMIEQQYNNRKHTENSTYVQACVDNFLDNEPIVSIETLKEVSDMLAAQIPVEALNMTMAGLVTDSNRVALLFIPDKDGYIVPSEDEMAELLAAVEAENIEAYAEEVKSEPLIPALPVPGTIASERKLGEWNATEWTLGNGARVVVLPTDFKDDEVLFGAYAPGGTNILGDDQLHNIKYLPYALSRHGFGSYTSVDLKKYLAGKNVNLAYAIESDSRGLAGASSVADMPALFELIYCAFTEFDLGDSDFEASRDSYRSILHSQQTNPQFIFSERLQKAVYENPRRHILSTDDIDSADASAITDIVRRMTADASDYTFVFVGNVDADSLRPLVEQYLATLPADAAHKVSGKELPGMGVKAGTEVSISSTKMETPQTWVFIDATATLPFSLDDMLAADVAGMILSDRLLAKVREEMGAVYSIGASGMLENNERPNAHINTAFPMKPEFEKEVLEYISSQMKKMENDITDAEVNKALEFKRKEHRENSRRNDYVLEGIMRWVETGVDVVNPRDKALERITPAVVADFMKRLNNQGNYCTVVLRPE